MSTEDARKLFVAGLPDTITEDVLRQLFEATGGTVVDVSIPRDRATGKPRGFGFVTMSTSEQAGGARNSLDGSVQAGRSISVRPFQAEPPKRSERSEGPRQTQAPSPDRTLYVGNLPYDCSEGDLDKLLKDAGVEGIARVNLPVGNDGRRRGFGFVNMASGEAATTALEKLKGAEMSGRRLIINVAHAKGERPPRQDRFEGSPRGGGGGRSAASPDPVDFNFMPPPPPQDVPRRSHDDRKRARPDNDWGHRGSGRPKRKERRRSGRRRGGFSDDYDDE